MKLKAFQLTQGDTNLYVTKLSLEELANPGFSKPDAWTPGNREGYQRMPKERRFKRIADYISGEEASKPLLPQALILNSRHNLTFRPDDSGSSLGMLEIPKEAMPLYEVDGQHRIGGIRRALSEDPSLSSFPIPVVITENLPQLDEAVLFYVINHEQKKVPTDLAQRIIEQKMTDTDMKLKIIAEGKDWIPVGTRIVDILNAEPNNPWHQMIEVPGQGSRTGTKQVSFVQSLKPILTAGGVYQKLDAEQIAELLIRYWRALEKVFPTALSDPSNHVIRKTVGIFPLHSIATTVFDLAREDDRKITEDAILGILEPLAESLAQKYEYDDPSEFWNRDPEEGEAGKYTGAKGFKIIASILKERMPPADIEQLL